MNRSEEIKDLAAALALAQAEMHGAKKDSDNPFFKSKYADLAAVWDAVRIPLTKRGLSIIQLPGTSSNGEIMLTTMILHASGQWISESVNFTPKDPSPQAVGSAITYFRRYGLMAIAGVAAEDDDGEGAMARSKPVAPKVVPPRPEVKVLPLDQQQRFWAMAKGQSGWTENEVRDKMKILFKGKDNTSALSQEELAVIWEIVLKNPKGKV